MIDPDTKLPVSDTNGSHPDKVLSEIIRGYKIIEDKAMPENTILLVPEITVQEGINFLDKQVKRYFKWDDKTGSIISNVG